MTNVTKTLIAVLAIIATTRLAAETGYAPGHGALEVFDDKGFAAAPTWIKVWIGFMLAVFATGLYYAWHYPLARWAPAGFILGAVSGDALFSALGLPFLSGSIAIMHLVCWSPALILLLWKRPFLDHDNPGGYRLWSAVMTATILFSFVFDLRDAFIYIRHLVA